FGSPSRLLEECHRALKPGGLLLLSTPNRNSLTGITGRFVSSIVVRRWNAWDKTHRHLYTPSELAATLARFGFESVKQAGFWFLPDIPYLSPARGLLRRRTSQATARRSAICVTLGFVTILVARQKQARSRKRSPMAASA